MKLNNKGFAITTVLYGLLILFVFLVGSYMVALSVKKDRVEDVTTEIEEEYRLNLKDRNLALHINDMYTYASKKKVVNNNVMYNYATSVSLMNDRLGGTTTSLDGGNVRYYGANPNNYIYFNCDDYSNQRIDTCELWRIIGVFDGKVKIMRNASAIRYSWDNKISGLGSADLDGGGSNDWTDSRLMILLNGGYEDGGIALNGYEISEYEGSLYWNAKLGTCYSMYTSATDPTRICDFTNTGLKNAVTRNMISSTLWYLGGTPSLSGVGYSDDTYFSERSDKVYENNYLNWEGKIALPYPSDYGYAGDFRMCDEPISYNYYDNDTCTSNNWMSLLGGYYWLLKPTSNTDSLIYSVASSGWIGTNPANEELNVFPTLFLGSETIIKGGTTGSIYNPYKIVII